MTDFTLVFNFRSSRPAMFCKKGVLKAFPEACNFIKIETLARVSCEFYEIFKNIFFYRTSMVAASVISLFFKGTLMQI